MYGTTVVGTKGQVVIPKEARKDLHIKPGDRLLVLGKMDKALGLMKAEHLGDLIKHVMDMVSDDSKAQKDLKKHISKIFPQLNK